MSDKGLPPFEEEDCRYMGDDQGGTPIGKVSAREHPLPIASQMRD